MTVWPQAANPAVIANPKPRLAPVRTTRRIVDIVTPTMNLCQPGYATSTAGSIAKHSDWLNVLKEMWLTIRIFQTVVWRSDSGDCKRKDFMING
jgi:hypothetical protein